MNRKIKQANYARRRPASSVLDFAPGPEYSPLMRKKKFYSSDAAMKAIVCTKYGPPEVLRLVERPKPAPKQDEILVKIYATSVTNSDLFIRSSDVPLRLRILMRLMIGVRRPRNEIIGEVFAGEVEAAGGRTKRFQPGDQVYGLTGMSLGAYADYKTMNEVDSKRGCIALMPANLSFEEATSAAYGGLLALQSLEPADIQPGHKVLVYGAASTSGVISVQYAKHRGAEVTGVCSEGKADFVRSLGAAKVLDYTKDESVDKLDIYDLVMDAVGKARSSKLKEACRSRVRDRRDLVSIDGGALVCDSERLGRLKELVEAGAIRPVNDRIYPFEKMAEAHRYVALGHKTGNVAVTVNQKT
jgi:NADPH:quinone reductase-like Zn-dependent oxidoreductase